MTISGVVSALATVVVILVSCTLTELFTSVSIGTSSAEGAIAFTHEALTEASLMELVLGDLTLGAVLVRGLNSRDGLVLLIGINWTLAQLRQTVCKSAFAVIRAELLGLEPLTETSLVIGIVRMRVVGSA